MLIRITNHCTAGCSHCMIDASGPNGAHMSADTFAKALRLTHALGSRVVVVSGGEPTDHPDYALFLAHIAALATPLDPHIAILATNGLFALDPAKLSEVAQVARRTGTGVQVTSDPRFYSRNLSPVRHLFDQPGWAFVGQLGGQLFPCRRVRENRLVEQGHATKAYPACVNLVLNVKYGGMALLDVVQGLQLAGRACSPSINVDGSVRLGESDTCLKIGTVDSSVSDLETAIHDLTCNRCGLWAHILTPKGSDPCTVTP